jgi:hypothetical protein
MLILASDKQAQYLEKQNEYSLARHSGYARDVYVFYGHKLLTKRLSMWATFINSGSS